MRQCYGIKGHNQLNAIKPGELPIQVALNAVANSRGSCQHTACVCWCVLVAPGAIALDYKLQLHAGHLYVHRHRMIPVWHVCHANCTAGMPCMASADSASTADCVTQHEPYDCQW